MAAGVPTVMTASASDTDATSYTTASVTFTAGRYYLIGAHIQRVSAPATNPTISGTTSGTWTSITGNTYGTIASPHPRLTARWFFASTTFSETILIDCGGTTQSGAAWIILEITGAANAAPVQAPALARTDSATSQSVTLSAFASGSVGVGFAAVNTVRTYTALNSYTLLGTNQQGAAPGCSLQALYKQSTGDPGVSWTTASDSAIIGVEIGASSGSWGHSLSDRLNRLVIS